MPLTLYLRLVAKQVNSVEATKKLVQMSHLFWHFSKKQFSDIRNISREETRQPKT